MSGLEVRPAGHTGCRRGSWAVFDGEERVSGVYNLRREAVLRLEAIERRRSASVRPCLRCATTIRSEGAHHRLCARCSAGCAAVSPMEPM